MVRPPSRLPGSTIRMRFSSCWRRTHSYKNPWAKTHQLVKLLASTLVHFGSEWSCITCEFDGFFHGDAPHFNWSMCCSVRSARALFVFLRMEFHSCYRNWLQSQFEGYFFFYPVLFVKKKGRQSYRIARGLMSTLEMGNSSKQVWWNGTLFVC